jgi:hypothetical protein
MFWHHGHKLLQLFFTVSVTACYTTKRLATACFAIEAVGNRCCCVGFYIVIELVQTHVNSIIRFTLAMTKNYKCSAIMDISCCSFFSGFGDRLLHNEAVGDRLFHNRSGWQPLLLCWFLLL